MEAIDFYNKRINEDSTIGSIQLMEEYAKHIIEINFCDGTSSDIENLTFYELKKIQKNIKLCVDWVNA